MKKTNKKEEKREINRIIINSIDNIPISIPTLLFGPFYLIYNKIYTPAIVTLIIYIFTSMCFNFELNVLIKILINIFLAFKYNKIKKPKRKLNIFILISIILSYVLIIKLVNFNKPIEYKPTTSRLNNLTYITPKNVKEYKHTKKAKYYILKEKKKGNCFITISLNNSKKYNIPEQYISESQKYNIGYKKYNIKKDKINNINWTKQKLENDISKKELYVTINNNTLYEIKFESTNSKNDLCSSIKKELLNTIKIKEMK